MGTRQERRAPVKILVPAESNHGLESPVCSHFGRCPYFVVVDILDDQVRDVCAVYNPFYGANKPGQVPAFVHGQQADVLLAGVMDCRAMAMFEELGIKPVCGAKGTVAAAIKGYLTGGAGGGIPCSQSKSDMREGGNV